MTGLTAIVVMYLGYCSKRGHCCYVTIQTQAHGIHTVSMAMVVKVANMTGLTVAAVRAVSTAADRNSCGCAKRVVAGGSRIFLANADKRCRSCGMTVQTHGNCSNGCAVVVLVSIKIGAVAGCTG